MAGARRRRTSSIPKTPNDPAIQNAKNVFAPVWFTSPIDAAFVEILKVALANPFAVGVIGFGEMVHVANDGHPPTVNVIGELKLPCDPILSDDDVELPAAMFALFPAPNCTVKSACEATTNPAVGWL